MELKGEIMEYEQSFKDWTEDNLYDFICKHYYVSGSDKRVVAEKVMQLLGHYGKLKNTNNDVIGEEKYKENCNG